MYLGFVFVALIAVTALVRSFMERRSLVAEHYSLGSGSTRLAFLTDIHDRLGERDRELITGALRDEGAELILIGGDVLTVAKRGKEVPDTEGALRLIEALCAVAPVIYGEGNHEERLKERFPQLYREYVDRLRALGVQYLRDSHVEAGSLAIYSASLPMAVYETRLPGIGRSGSKYPLPQGYLAEKLGEPVSAGLTVLLLHSPLYLTEAHDWGADLVLSGHFHGGTVRVPLLGGLMTPQLQFFLPETAGQFSCGSATMIVSRGIGTHSVRLRLFDLPELTLIDIDANDNCRAKVQDRKDRV